MGLISNLWKQGESEVDDSKVMEAVNGLAAAIDRAEAASGIMRLEAIKYAGVLIDMKVSVRKAAELAGKQPSHFARAFQIANAARALMPLPWHVTYTADETVNGGQRAELTEEYRKARTTASGNSPEAFAAKAELAQDWQDFISSNGMPAITDHLRAIARADKVAPSDADKYAAMAARTAKAISRLVKGGNFGDALSLYVESGFTTWELGGVTGVLPTAEDATTDEDGVEYEDAIDNGGETVEHVSIGDQSPSRDTAAA